MSRSEITTCVCRDESYGASQKVSLSQAAAALGYTRLRTPGEGSMASRLNGRRGLDQSTQSSVAIRCLQTCVTVPFNE